MSFRSPNPEDKQHGVMTEDPEGSVPQNYSPSEHAAWKHVKDLPEAYMYRIGNLLNTGRRRNELDGD